MNTVTTSPTRTVAPSNVSVTPFFDLWIDGVGYRLDVDQVRRLTHAFQAYLKGHENSPTEQLLQSIAKFYGVTSDHLRLKSREQHVVWRRQVAMYAIKQRTGMNDSAIAKLFGKADSTAVSWSRKVVLNRMATNSAMRHQVTSLFLDLEKEFGKV